MANIFLAWQNRADEATLSSGSWLTTLPLVNVQDRQVQKVARSTNATRASTFFDIDLGQSRVISAIALLVHNLSVNGYVRIRGVDSTATFTSVLTSPDLTNAAWTKSNATITNNFAAAPDNTVTATKVAATALGVATVFTQFTATGTVAHYTIFAKAGSGATKANQFRLRNSTTGQTLIGVSIDYTTGVLTTTYQIGSSAASVVECSDGWWALTLSAVSNVTAGDLMSVITVFAGDVSNAAGDYALVWEPTAANTNAPLYESGWRKVWPNGVIPQELLEWEDDNFWLGTLTQEQRAGYQSPYIVKLASVVTQRYWRIEIADTTNPAGYVQIGRLFMAKGWTPSVNYSYGAGLGYQDPTPVDTSLSGAEYFDVRSRYRVFNFGLEYITETEAYSNALELQRLAGISGEVLVMPDSADNLASQPLRAFVGRLQQSGAVTQPQPNTYSASFEVKELL